MLHPLLLLQLGLMLSTISSLQLLNAFGHTEVKFMESYISEARFMNSKIFSELCENSTV